MQYFLHTGLIQANFHMDIQNGPNLHENKNKSGDEENK